MNKNALYVILLTLILGSALYNQYQHTQAILERNPYYTNQTTLRNSDYLDGFFFEKYYNEKLPRNPFVGLVKGSEFLFHFESNDSTLFYHILEDSPSDMASVKVEKYQFNIQVEDDYEYARLIHAQGLREIVGGGADVILSKQEITLTAHSCDEKMALEVQSTKVNNLMMDLWYSPIGNILGLLVVVILIWCMRRFSSYIGGLFGVTEVPVLSLFVILFLSILPLSSYSTFLVVTVPSIKGTWDVILSLYGLYKFLPVAIFFLFRHLINRYKRRFDFIDLEALKFIFIVLTWLTFMFFDDYLLSFSFRDHENFVSRFDAPLLEAILYATANFLNNFRAHYFDLRRKEKSLTKANIKSLESKSELAALQSRVNPHFLYNSLNSIAALAESNPTKTKDMALALSGFYKYSTNREDEVWATCGEEIEMIKKYLEIEKIRFGEKLKVDIQCDDSLANYRIPKFLIQPLVENAIKYGYSATDDTIHVVVSISKEGNYKSITILVLDSGPDFPEDMDMGHGIRSVQKKLSLSYPDQHSFSFSNKRNTYLDQQMKGVVIILDNPEVNV